MGLLSNAFLKQLLSQGMPVILVTPDMLEDDSEEDFVFPKKKKSLSLNVIPAPMGG